MSEISPSAEFKEIAKKVAETGIPYPMNKQTLRLHFGNVSKLGRQIKDDISRELRRLKVTTEPSFRRKDLQEFTLIKSRTRTAPQSEQPQPDAPTLPPEIDQNGGELGELSICNQFPCFVHRGADAKVLFQRLVESGKRGIVLVVDRVDGGYKQGELTNPDLRRALGVVTWESYSRCIVNTPGNEANSQLSLPTPVDAMDRDIALAYATDDLIYSLQRIEKKGVLVVHNSGDLIIGLATKRDIHNELAEDLIPYQLIGLIENLLRSKIKGAGFSSDVFARASGNDKITSIEEMEFSNYVGIFSNADHFKKLNVHGAPKEMGQLLDKVRVFRNHLMHFNQEDDIDYAIELKSLYEAIRTLLNDE